jgi:hypothetical protein
LNSFLVPEVMMTVEFSAWALPSMSRMIRFTGPWTVLGVNVYVLSEGYKVSRINKDACSNSHRGFWKRRVNASRPMERHDESGWG